MIGMDILQPVVVLAAWTMVMWAWMYATRIPSMTQAKFTDEELSKLTTAKMDEILPTHVQWKAHNYNHLHEAPTVFYAVAVILAITGQGDGWAARLGWAYVALRVIHSLVQAIANKVILRFQVFVLSSLVLIALIALAALAVF
jgi:hypothetical protein